MTTKNNKTASKTYDLAQIKESASFNAATKELTWNGEMIDISDSLLGQVVILGVYRQASADSAKGGYSPEFEPKFLTRLRAGFLNDRAYQNSLKIVEQKPGTGKKPAFGQLEIIAQARSMTNDADTLSKLDIIAGYDDTKFSLLLAKVADNPQSIISLAIAELSRIASEKAAAEREQRMAEIVDV